MKRNLTIQLDEAIIRKARIVAAKRATSISRLVAQQIEEAVSNDGTYQRAQVAAIDRLKRPFHLGGVKLPDRESLHER